jgi:hypothetical protein
MILLYEWLFSRVLLTTLYTAKRSTMHTAFSKEVLLTIFKRYPMALLQSKDALKSITIKISDGHPDDLMWTFVSRLSEFE